MNSNRLMAAYAVAAGIFVGLASLLLQTDSRAFAQQGPTPTPPPTVPRNEPERGLIYDGLVRDSACGRGFRIPGTNRCTHGPDAPPFTLNVQESVPPLWREAANISSTFKCDGNGTSGYRIQVLYVRASDKQDRFNAYASSFRAWLSEMDLIYQHSAAETGGGRRVRFVHGADCFPTIIKETVSTTGDDSFSSTIGELEDMGYDRPDRKYIIFMDANRYCGIGTLSLDDSPSQNNWNNIGPDWGRTDAGCWSGGVPTHELTHNLGGVQDSAPNSTSHQNSGGHCSDEFDRMCYEDDDGVQMSSLCPNREHDRLLDCNHEDYFHTNPPAGNYLATHWNTAKSRFLGNAAPTCFPTLNVTDYPSETADDEVTVAWTITGTGCSTVRHTDIHWDTVSRAGEHPSHYRFSNYESQEQSGGLGDFESTISVSDDVESLPSSVYLVVHAFLDDAAEVVSPEYVVTFGADSATTTPTVTASPTVRPTATATLPPCDSKPLAPVMVYPPRKAVVTTLKIMLEWAFSECATSYNVWVRKDTKKGDVFRSKMNLGTSHFASKKMTDGATYVWRVEACNMHGCNPTRWRKFSVDLP